MFFLRVLPLALAAVFATTGCDQSLQRLTQKLEDKAFQAQAGDVQGLIAVVDSVLDGAAQPIRESKEIVPDLPLKAVCWDLLEEGNYSELEAELSRILDEQFHSADGNLIYTEVLEMLSPSKKVDSWVAQSPSIHAYAAAIDLSASRAWEARGDGVRSTVTPSGFKSFTAWLAEGDEHLKAARSLDPANPAVLKFASRIELGMGVSQPQLKTSIKTAQEAPVEDASVASNYVYHLTPRWHGSVTGMEIFLKEELPKWSDSAGKFRAMIKAIYYQIPPKFKARVLQHADTQAVFAKLMSRYVAEWPQGGEVMAEIAKMYNDAGLHQMGLDLCEAHLPRVPEHSELQLAKATSLISLGRRPEAMKVMLEAVAHDPKHARLNYSIAWLHTKTKPATTAVVYSQTAYDHFPVNDTFERGQCLLYLAGAEEERKNFSKMVDLATQALALDSNSYFGWFYIGKGRYEMGDRAGAKEAFEAYLRHSPENRSLVDRWYPDWKN